MKQRSLFGEPPPKSSQFHDRVAVFAKRWERSYRQPYHVTGADRRGMGTYLQSLRTLTEAQRERLTASWADTCDKYLRDRRQFTLDKTSSHSLRYLVGPGINEYSAKPRASLETVRAKEQADHEAVREDERQGGHVIGVLYEDACALPDYKREDLEQRMRVMDDCAALERKAKR